MQSLIGAVRDISGDTKGDPAPPDDFLGKVAHYGPGLAKNFLGPVMERVDAATQIANRSLTLQQQAMQGPPPGAPMLHGPPGAAGGQPQPQQYAPPAEPVYYEPAPMPPPQVPISDASPLVQIVDFLDSQLAQGADPQGTASLLQESVQAGMVPAEAFHAFVSRDRNTITGEVLDSAAARGAPHLNSPSGAGFIQRVLAVIKGETQ